MGNVISEHRAVKRGGRKMQDYGFCCNLSLTGSYQREFISFIYFFYSRSSLSSDWSLGRRASRARVHSCRYKSYEVECWGSLLENHPQHRAFVFFCAQDAFRWKHAVFETPPRSSVSLLSRQAIKIKEGAGLMIATTVSPDIYDRALKCYRNQHNQIFPPIVLAQQTEAER